MRRHHILIPLAALLAISPLLLHGCSCGHDFDFHLQSWLDAAQQMRHGTLYPRWAVTPAWNAGEPRFVFYPPLSWMLGALLSLVFPFAALPALYTFLILTAAGFAMHRLAREFVSPNAALLASAIYLANPYMLFTAFERTAYAELLAAVWLPLLFLAVLRARPTTHGIAIPLALLWITNAPAAVMGSYALALLALFRIIHSLRTRAQAAATRAPNNTPSPARLTLTYVLGTILGLALPAFYLIPAATERRYVQIAMAIIPNMRIQDNFLFGHTADAGHNTVLHTASVLAVTLLIITAIIALLALRKRTPLAAQLLILTAIIAFLLTPLSLPLWLHLPELAFLQFSWRLLAILTPILGLAIALLANTLRNSPRNRTITLIASPLIALALSLICIHLYRQPCDPSDTPNAIAQAFATHHGVQPTDEYTPNAADNDTIRPNNPSYWFSLDPQGFAPASTPNPGSSDPNFDGTFPSDETLSSRASMHFDVDHENQVAGYLVVNLRDYPNWQITTTDLRTHSVTKNQFIPRDDGLIAVPMLDSSNFQVDITWQTSRDQYLGYLITLLALITLAISFRLTPKPR